MVPTTLNPCPCCDFQSPLLSRIHSNFLLRRGYNVATLHWLRKRALPLTVGHNVATMCPMPRPSSQKRAKGQEKAERARKQDVVRFRVTDEQKQALTQAAEKEGLDVSAWLRQLALKAAGALPEAR